MRKKRLILAGIVAVLILAADQFTKYLVISNFKLYESVPFIKGFLNFTYIHNKGAAFGIFQGRTLPFIILTTIMLALGIFVLSKRIFTSAIMDWAILLVMAGGIGNLIDRIFRQGKVVDFIETAFMEFPVFNIADCSVVIGSGLIILYLILDTFKQKKVEQ